MLLEKTCLVEWKQHNGGILGNFLKMVGYAVTIMFKNLL